MVRRRTQNIDYVILTSIVLLVVIGFVALASASSDLGKLKFDDPFYYLKRQAFFGLSVGILGLLAGYHIDYRKYKKISPILFFIALGAVLLTFTPLGVVAGGAARWLQFGPVTVQPAELLKLFFIGYLAAWLSSTRADRQKSISDGLIPFLSISGIVAIILLAQRSTSAAVILMGGALAVYFVGGARKRYVFATIGIGLILLGGIILLTPYRLERVRTFINPAEQLEGAGYQINQALVTIGSGGMFGVGYGQSTIKTSLPERVGDSIYAVIAQEFGFVGAVVLIFLFFSLVARGFLLSKRAKDGFGRLLLVGFSTIIGLQVFIHVGGNSGLVPLTGVPLPFISSGGTALAVFMTMGGVMLNISKRI